MLRLTGSPPSLPDRLGQTPLHRASLKGDLVIVMIEVFLRDGAEHAWPRPGSRSDPTYQ
jgi:hypothetical protein